MSFKSRELQNSGFIDAIYLLFVCVYLVYLMFTTTTFALPVPGWFVKVCFLLIFLLTIIRIILLKEKNSFPLYGGLLLFCIYLLVYRADRYSFILFLGIITLGCVKYPYYRFLKVFSILLGAFLCITVFGALGGAIQNLVYIRDGYIRSSLGICYPTDLATTVFFFILFAWVAWREYLPTLSGVILAFAFILFAKYITLSETGVICGMVMALLSGVLFVDEKTDILEKIPGTGKFLLRNGVIFLFPILGGIMFGLMYFYDKGNHFAVFVDTLFSGRLEHSVNAFHNYGITLFGSPFDQNGNGFSTFSSQVTNFVDSTYPLIAIRYGIVLFGAITCVWCLATKRAIECQNKRLVLAMVLLTIHAFSEHHFIEANYNPMLLMLFADYQHVNENYQERIRYSFDHRRIVIGVIELVAAWIMMPYLLSRFRTLIEIWGWYGGGEHSVKVLPLIIGILAFFVIFMIASCAVFSDISVGRKIHRRYIVICLLTVCVIYGGSIYSGNVIAQEEENYYDLVREDSPMLTKILSVAEGNIYVDYLTDIYKLSFPEIDLSIWHGDDLARLKDTTVVIDRDYDSNCFINSGFLFLPISESHAIYTNDLSVINGLETGNHHFTGYYSIEKSVPLKRVAYYNGLPFDSTGSIVLNGKDQSILQGPYLSLYGGQYSIWYDLELGKNIKDRINNGTFSDVGIPIKGTANDALLGTIKVSAHYGNKDIQERQLFLSDFDNNGKCTIQIPFTIGNYSGIEYLLLLENNTEVVLKGMRYARTPDYDVHSFYNKKRLKYRDEYYSLDGDKTETSDGYFACEYGYNHDRVVNEIRYYNKNNDAVLNKEGYAKVVRSLDGKNRVVREDYYGLDGNLILLPQGYAANERVYNEDNQIAVQRYFGVDGEPVITQWNYAEIHREFNNNAQITREEYYGTDGNLCLLPQGYAITERVYDKNGNAVVLRFFGTDGKPVITTWNYAEVHRQFDEKNQMIREEYIGKDGEAIAMPAGYVAEQRQYDAAGNIIVQKFFGADDEPVLTAWGYAEVHKEYNENKQVIWESYFDVNGDPILMPQGYAYNGREYDGLGNPIVQKYYDIDKNLVMTTWNYAEVHRVFDNKHQVIREEYYDTKGAPAKMTQGYTATEREYDAAGNMAVQRFYGDDGNLVITTWRFAEVRRVFDDKRRIIRESYFDTNGKPQSMPEGYAVNEREYDDKGNISMQRYCDGNGMPVITKWHYAEVRRVFDSMHRVICESYYDTNGMPLSLPSGFAKLQREYNANNQVVKECYYNTIGQLTNTNLGYATVIFDYNLEGELISKTYVDSNGKIANRIGIES